MAEQTFKLRKLFPPFGTAESPLWEFGYDEEVRVVGGFCDVRSPDLRDRLLKMGYEEAASDEEVEDEPVSEPSEDPEPED